MNPTASTAHTPAATGAPLVAASTVTIAEAMAASAEKRASTITRILPPRGRAHVLTADSSHSPRLVKPTITTSIQY
jgi:hypothetical protein